MSSFIKTAFYNLEINQNLEDVFDNIIALLSKSEEIHQTVSNDLEKLIKDVKAKHGTKYNYKLSLIEKNFKDKPVYIFEENRLNGGLLSGLIPALVTKKIIKK